jgi:prepilin-type N-terminal cleavage/methylation domain-containing protein
MSRTGEARPDHGRSRFTLIELLVVVSIIAILAAMLLPALSAARERGRQAVCLSNLKQVGICFQLYGDDYDEALIPLNGPVDEWPQNSWGTGYWGTNWKAHWVHQCWAYMGRADGCLICPTATGAKWYTDQYATTVAGGGWRTVTIDGTVWDREWI